MIAATRGAIAAARSGSSWASRVRRDRTSSSDNASSLRTAQATSASMKTRPGTSGWSRPSSAPSATTAGASVPCRATSRCRGLRVRSRGRPGWSTARRRSGRGAPCRPHRRVVARRSRSGRRFAPSGPRTASITSRAITRYVVYFPPPIRTTPLARTVTRCSREALTVDPSEGAISGRSPAYVPTTSARRQIDVHRRVDRVEQPVHFPAGRATDDRPARRTARPSCRSARGRAMERGRRPCPARGSSARSCSGCDRAGRRGGRRGSAGSGAIALERMVGLGRPDPVASTTRGSGSRRPRR